MRQATATDLPDVLELLEANELPTAGVEDHLEHFLLEFANEKLIGCAGLEIHGEAGLLRSVTIARSDRSKGLGSKLVQTILEHAREQKLSSLSLLTTTAQHYFPRFGFQITTRASLPESLNASAEFRGACPDSAIAMTLNLEQRDLKVTGLRSSGSI
jgi:amino-acid N-acetyltransferase